MERTISNNQILTFFLGTAISLLASACASLQDPAVPAAQAPAQAGAVAVLPADKVPASPPATDPVTARAEGWHDEPGEDLVAAVVDVAKGESAVLDALSRESVALTHESIWTRLREGFQLPPLDSPLIARHERWFVENAEFRAAMFERANRYLYYIVEEVDKRGMPLEIALLPAIESAYKPYAYSRARASGLWQFIPSTGRLYGLKTNWWYDGRRDIVASTRAALDYLEKLVGDFDGDWHLALAAYNAGEGRIMRAIRWNRNRGLPTDFAHLRQIRRETKHYVPKLMAMVNIVSDPGRFGIELPDIPNAPFFTLVETDSQVDLGVIARLTEMEVDELHFINPGYRRWATDPNGPHHLLVPIGKKDMVVAGLSNLPAEERVQWLHHQVRRGDTLYHIARRYGLTVGAIKAANNLRSSLLQVGQNLMLPISANARVATAARAGAKPVRAATKANRPIVHKVRRGDTLYDLARYYGVTVRAIKAANNLRSNMLRVGQNLSLPISANARPVLAATKANRPIVHKVRRGETLSSIAQRYNVLVRQIAEWNVMRPNDILHMGRKLKIWIDHGPQAFHGPRKPIHA